MSKPVPNKTSQFIAVQMARIHSSNKCRNQTLLLHYHSTFNWLPLKTVEEIKSTHPAIKATLEDSEQQSSGLKNKQTSSIEKNHIKESSRSSKIGKLGTVTLLIERRRNELQRTEKAILCHHVHSHSLPPRSFASAEPFVKTIGSLKGTTGLQ